MPTDDTPNVISPDAAKVTAQAPDVTCKSCGAQYTVKRYELGGKDRDHADCDDCGAELFSWKGHCCFIATRIPRNVAATS